MTSRRAALGCLVMWVGSVTALATAIEQSRPDTSIETTLAAMRSYLSQYRTELTFVIAEERSSQQINRQFPTELNAPRTRTTTSDVHFRFVEDDNSWMAIREVNTVDGQPASRLTNLAAALRNLNAGVVARNFKTFNSRFNIGRIVRTFNEPTLPLDILEPGRIGHFTFKREGSKVQDGVTLVTLSFNEERSSDPFIFDLLMQQADVQGEFLVEADTGRIRKTTLKAKMGNVRAELTTTYAHDKKLDLWVPVNFKESYEDGSKSTLRYEKISCESTYSNFRRFSATGRIK